MELEGGMRWWRGRLREQNRLDQLLDHEGADKHRAVYRTEEKTRQWDQTDWES